MRKTSTLTCAAVALACALAGCGTSTAPGVQLAPSAGSTAAAITTVTATSTTATSTTAASTTTGALPAALNTKPSVPIPKGAPPSKLVIKDLIKGTGEEAKAGDTVTVNDVGVVYKTGKQFENTFTRKEPSTFALSGLIPGFGKGVVGMKVGGRRELIIPAALGYGKAGSPPKIPPNAPLIFVIDLLKA